MQRQSTPSSTPNKATPNKPNSTPNSTPHHPLTRSATAPSTPSTPHNNSLGVSFPISSGQLSSMQHPISTTPQHAPYPLTPTGLRKPVPGLPSGYPPPPLNPNSPYSPRIGGHIPPAIPNTITRPPPLLPLQKSQSTNNMMPRPPLSSLVPSIPTPQRPPAPVGKPGARPPGMFYFLSLICKLFVNRSFSCVNGREPSNSDSSHISRATKKKICQNTCGRAS